MAREHTNSPSSRRNCSTRHSSSSPVDGASSNLSRFVFSATGDHSPALYLRIRLLLAGDIESNPGPPTWRCFKCFRDGRANLTPLICPCGATSHRQESFSGISRYADNTNWRCPRCTTTTVATIVGRPVNQLAHLPAPTSSNHSSNQYNLVTKSTHCLKCNKNIPASIRVLACCNCKRPCHLKESCSLLSRSAQKSFVARGTWLCNDCVDLQLQPCSSSSAQPTNRPKLRTRKSLRLLQWNCCGARSKQAEIEEVMRVNKIDVACIQESKLRSGDITPKFAGYCAIRQDRRNQAVVGGGLLTIVKDDLPFQRLQSASFGNLEMLNVRLLLGGRDSIQIVNVYRPPIRSTARESRTPESE